MTNRIHSITLILEKDIRTDDAEDLLKLLHNIRGVIEVQPNIHNIDTAWAYSRAQNELKKKL